MFSDIHNPRPVSECYVNPLLPKSDDKLNRQFIQHRLNRLVGLPVPWALLLALTTPLSATPG